MKPILGLTLLLCLPLALHARSPEAELRTLAPGTWLSYEVPLQPGLRAPCCFSWNGRKASDTSCRLDRDDWNFGHRSDAPAPPADAGLRVFLRRGGDGFDRVHAVGTHCPVERGGAVVSDVGAMAPEASVALLETALKGGKERKRQHALPAIAYHDTEAADAALQRASASSNPEDVRRDAVFWLAEARGEHGWRHVRSLLAAETDEDLRRHMVFAISISDAVAAQAELRMLAADPGDGIGGEAIFWLAQNEDPQTEALARGLLASKATKESHDKAVFALSQLPSERAIAALRSLIEGNHSQAVRKQALFWLAQVDDDAVLPVFDDLLGGRR